MRYRVSRQLNYWVVQDTELLLAKKRSTVYECKTREDAIAVCALCNDGQPVPPDPAKYFHVASRR